MENSARPDPRRDAPFAALDADFVRFSCRCGRRLLAPAAMGGQAARCPACLTVARVPAPAKHESKIPELAPVDELPEVAPIEDAEPEVEPIEDEVEPVPEGDGELPELPPMEDAPAARNPVADGKAEDGDAGRAPPAP